VKIQKIKEKLKSLGISQAELAKQIFSDSAYISKVLNEKVSLSKKMEEKINLFLDYKEKQNGIVDAEVVHYVHSYCPECSNHNVGVIEHNSYCNTLLDKGNIVCSNCEQKYQIKIDKQFRK